MGVPRNPHAILQRNERIAGTRQDHFVTARFLQARLQRLGGREGDFLLLHIGSESARIVSAMSCVDDDDLAAGAASRRRTGRLGGGRDDQIGGGGRPRRRSGGNSWRRWPCR